MALLPDAGIETMEDKLKTVLKLRSATGNDIPVLMHMARALAEQQGLASLMTATAAGWRRDLGKAFDATVAAIKNKPVGMALTVCMPLPGATARMTELVGLYVAPPFRRRGVGAALVRHVLAEARNNKVACVRLVLRKTTTLRSRLIFVMALSLLSSRSWSRRSRHSPLQQRCDRAYWQTTGGPRPFAPPRRDCCRASREAIKTDCTYQSPDQRAADCGNIAKLPELLRRR